MPRATLAGSGRVITEPGVIGSGRIRSDIVVVIRQGTRLQVTGQAVVVAAVKPGAITNFNAVAASSSVVNLSWTNPTSGGAVTALELNRSPTGTGSWSANLLTGVVSSFSDTNKSAQTLYFYRIRPMSGTSAGDYVTDSVTTQSEQTVPGVKWHPGHYVDPDATLQSGNTSTWTGLLSQISGVSTSRIRGLTLKINWGVLEPTTKGNFVWTTLDNMIAAVAAQGRKSIIRLSAVSFGTSNMPSTPQSSSNRTLPDYIISGGFAYISTQPTLNLKTWEATANGHYIDMLEAIANRYDDDDRVAMVTTSEGSFAPPANGSISTSQMNPLLYTQGVRIAQEAKPFFTKTPFAIYNNFWSTQALCGQMTQVMIDEGVAVGVPDIFTNGQLQWNYRYVDGQQWNGSSWSTVAPDRFDSALCVCEKQVNRDLNWTPTIVYNAAVSDYEAHFVNWTLQNTAYLYQHSGEAAYRIPAMDRANIISYLGAADRPLRTDIPANV